LRQAYDYWQDQPGNYLEARRNEKLRRTQARRRGRGNSTRVGPKSPRPTLRPGYVVVSVHPTRIGNGQDAALLHEVNGITRWDFTRLTWTLITTESVCLGLNSFNRRPPRALTCSETSTASQAGSHWGLRRWLPGVNHDMHRLLAPAYHPVSGGKMTSQRPAIHRLRSLPALPGIEEDGTVWLPAAKESLTQ
jgi:hypothetical protein